MVQSVIGIIRKPSRRGAQLRLVDGGVFSFDATMSETVTNDSEITDHPIERGVEISDHVQDTPIELSLVTMISNSPLPSQGALEFDRDKRAYQNLKAIKAAREPVTVVTGLDIYENMLLKTITVTREAGGPQEVISQLTFREIVFAEQQTIVVPGGKREASGTGKGNAGRQEAAEVGAAAAAAATTAAAEQANAEAEAAQAAEATTGATTQAEAQKAEGSEPRGSALNSVFG